MNQTILIWLSVVAGTSDSANFVVVSEHSRISANNLASDCEKFRRKASIVWQPEPGLSTWSPRCTVVVHRTRASYLQQVGRGGEQTLGSSLIEFSGSRIKMRRVDLLPDTDGNLSALQHELTHVILADLIGRQPPRWADEGIATLADGSLKRKLHRRDLVTAFNTGTAIRLGELLTLERFTHPEQLPAFYGQSLSLVNFLADRKGEPELIRFVNQATRSGYDKALRECYQIESVAELERLWHHAELKPIKQTSAITQ